MQTAKRITNVSEYYFSKKLKEITQRIKQGEKILNLGIGNPDLPPSNKVIDTLKKQSDQENKHGYQSYIGIPELREGFTRWYEKYFNVKLNPENEVLPLIGSKEGIMHISMAYLNPNDAVLIPNPGYPTYEAVTQLVGAKIIRYNLNQETNWQPQISQLEQQDLSQVKIMWINYPNMPTGAVADDELFTNLIQFAKKHQILLCNDNPYSFILNEETKSILSIEGAKEVALELNSLSKSHNMAGWRVGMVAGNKTLIGNILKVKSNMDSGMFYPIQAAAVEALNSNDHWYKSMNEIYKKRRTIVWKIFEELECTYHTPQTGMFVWAKIPENQKQSFEFSDILLNKYQIFITPGSIFGSNGDQYMRISLCAKEEILNETLNRIKDKKNL